MISVLVTGANGQLGSELRALSTENPDMRITSIDRQHLDILDTAKLKQLIDLYWPDFIVNTAAYTNVEKAEDDQRRAFQINAEALSPIGELCRKRKIKIVHISSDYVYHSNIEGPLNEEITPTPKGLYARSKYQGEQNLLDTGAEALILRTSWLYSAYGKNFVKTMLALGKEKEHLQVINDQYGAPTYARDLAKAILHIIRQSKIDGYRWEGEVFNFANRGVTTWFDFAKRIFKLEEMEVHVEPISSADYPTKAERPPNSRLALDKIQTTWGLEIRHWEDALEDMLYNLKEMENKKWRP